MRCVKLRSFIDGKSAVREVSLADLCYICSMEEWMSTDWSVYRTNTFVFVRSSRYVLIFPSS